MRLVSAIEGRLAAERSMLRAQLLREDLARLRRLAELAAASADRVSYIAAARRLGWTQGDARTPELAHVLVPLVEAVYDYQHGEEGEVIESRIEDAWDALSRERLGGLVGSFSAPAPRPAPE